MGAMPPLAEERERGVECITGGVNGLVAPSNDAHYGALRC